MFFPVFFIFQFPLQIFTLVFEIINSIKSMFGDRGFAGVVLIHFLVFFVSECIRHWLLCSLLGCRHCTLDASRLIYLRLIRSITHWTWKLSILKLLLYSFHFTLVALRSFFLLIFSDLLCYILLVFGKAALSSKRKFVVPFLWSFHYQSSLIVPVGVVCPIHRSIKNFA